MNIETIRAGTVLVESAASKGSAYLIGPKTLATCHHVVESSGAGGTVQVLLPGGKTQRATVAKLDEQTDCAILELDDQIPGKEPLPLAARCESRALWDGYGFPGLTAGAGLPFFGTVLEADAEDDKLRPMIALYSDMVAAGMAAAINGLSGGPVVVDGAVVGHFSRVLGTPGKAGQPALGIVYAARSANVLSLAGLAPAIPVAAAPLPPPLHTEVPKIGATEYHVFISYRSTDRAFAKRLYERMDAIGLRVFLDERELVPGDDLAAALSSALARSKAGVVLVSSGWKESAWCLEEGSRLLKRAVEVPGFRVVPVRLEAIAMPDMFDSRLWVDFAGEAVPSGGKLNDVIYAVLGKRPPVEGSTEAKAQTTLTAATDEALDRVDELVKQKIRDPRRFRGLVDYLKQVGLPVVAARLRAADELIKAGWLKPALEILPPAEDSLRARQLRALAQSKLGNNQEALDLLEPLQDNREMDAESAGILGGIYKRMWLATRQDLLLRKSLQRYADAYTRTGDVYVGINAATLAILREKPGEPDGLRIAAEILERLGAKKESELSNWDVATLAEAFLVLGDAANALKWYERAAEGAANRPQAIAVMRRQARLVYEKRKWACGPLIEALPTSRIVAFSGHLTDTPGRAVPRFPEAKVDSARRAIQKWLRGRGVATHAVCSAARGGDLLFLEQVLEQNGTATVLLPFPRADFIDASVGSDWSARFDTVLKNDRVELLTPLSEKAPPEGPLRDAMFEQCNSAIVDEAERLAELFDEREPTLLTLWNGAPGATGGTAHVVSIWTNRGYPAENIDIAKL